MPILDAKIHVPVDATAKGIIANTRLAFEQVGLPLTYLNKKLEEVVDRDLDLVRGKVLDVLTNDFGRIWDDQACRDFQKPRMFDGNAAALLIWAAKTKPHGFFVSISNDETILYAPYFHRNEDGLQFNLRKINVGRRWARNDFSVSFSFRVSDLEL